ncbi:MAG: 4Fe-4S binding protein [Methanoculleaceae archaeon]
MADPVSWTMVPFIALAENASHLPEGGLLPLPSLIGGIYADTGIIILAILWHKKIMTRRRNIAVLLLTTFLGFAIFAPIFPPLLQMMILDLADGMPVTPTPVFALTVVFILSILFGRIVCGSFCAVGSIQELLSHISPPRIEIRDNRVPPVVRLFIFAVMVILAVQSIDLIHMTGLNAFFHLNIHSVLILIFIAILALSLVIYRPFCRFICPYGAILSLAAMKSGYCFCRTDTCINCGKCEEVCPTGEAAIGSSKAECYMCGRCVAVCPVEGALEYRRRE